MKITWNWGTGIAIVIGIFMTFIISVITFSFSQDVNLVSKDYYPDELVYQEQIQKQKNTESLKEKVSISIKGKQTEIKFPAFTKTANISGTVYFYYIKNYRKDKNYTIETDENSIQLIDTDNLSKGRYYVKIDWRTDSTKYYQEIELNLE